MRKYTHNWQTNWTKKLSRSTPLLAVIIVFGGLGTALLITSHAATPAVPIEAESGTATTTAKIADTSASGSQAVKFAAGTTDGGGGTGTRTCPAYPAFPDANCTGVPAGTALTTISGGYTTTSDGQHIDGKLITGDLDVHNKNVVVTNSRIVGRIANDSSGLIVTDSDVGLDSCPATHYEDGDFNNFDGTDYTMIRTHVHNSGADLTGMGGTGTILIQDSIINQACYYDGDHLDAIQFYSPGDVGHITITHTILDSRAVNNSSLGNSAIFWADTPGNGSSLTVTQSELAGGNYTASLYDATAGSRIILDIENSTFVANSWQYGYCSSSNSVAYNGQEGVKFVGNIDSTGKALNGC